MLRVKPSAADKLESASSRTPQTRQLGNILGHPNADCESAARGEDDGTSTLHYYCATPYRSWRGRQT